MPDFSNDYTPDYDNYWYDLFIDWDLIEASFAQQYGIRLTTTDLSYAEFSRLLSGLLPDTPLGKVVGIRAETDKNMLKNFSKDQKRIRSEWMLHKNEVIKQDNKAYKNKYDRLQELCKAAFS
jgi:hypothetical protein